jgi:hypothetical protein
LLPSRLSACKATDPSLKNTSGSCTPQWRQRAQPQQGRTHLLKVLEPQVWHRRSDEHAALPAEKRDPLQH